MKKTNAKSDRLLCLLVAALLLLELFTRAGVLLEAPNLDPASVVDTNEYLELIQVGWTSVPGAVGYHVNLETNGHAVCGDFYTWTNSIAIWLPSTNAYSIPCIWPTDGTNILLFQQRTCQLQWEPIPATMVTISWFASSCPVLVQSSQDLRTWSTIAAGLMDTNLTYSIDRTRSQFWRVMDAAGKVIQPTCITTHY